VKEVDLHGQHHEIRPAQRDGHAAAGDGSPVRGLVRESVDLATIGGGGGTVNAPIDVHETADEIVVTASLPGMKPEDVDITMTGQTLTLKGEFKSDQEEDRGEYLYRERRFGSFNRTLQLPVRVEGERAEASFDNGVLTLRIPKSEEVKPRQIQIKPAHETTGATTKDAG
jgi:HSP20 family protein